MNGIMFYLDRDLPLVHGHTVYIDSPWALTSISQAQFWPAVELEEMGDGRVGGILSVDVSDWEAPGIVHGKQAMYCSKRGGPGGGLGATRGRAGGRRRRRARRRERARLVPRSRDRLPESDERDESRAAADQHRRLVEDRPEAATAIDNLFLASDYVRTYTDLATMEGANEAARRAVNGILERTGSNQPRCPLWELAEPAIFAPARALDRVLFALHRPPPQQFRVVDGRIEASTVASLGASAVERVSRIVR